MHVSQPTGVIPVARMEGFTQNKAVLYEKNQYGVLRSYEQQNRWPVY